MLFDEHGGSAYQNGNHQRYAFEPAAVFKVFGTTQADMDSQLVEHMDTWQTVGIGIVSVNDISDKEAERIGTGDMRAEGLAVGEDGIQGHGDTHTGAKQQYGRDKDFLVPNAEKNQSRADIKEPEDIGDDKCRDKRQQVIQPAGDPILRHDDLFQQIEYRGKEEEKEEQEGMSIIMQEASEGRL